MPTIDVKVKYTAPGKQAVKLTSEQWAQLATEHKAAKKYAKSKPKGK